MWNLWLRFMEEYFHCGPVLIVGKDLTNGGLALVPIPGSDLPIERVESILRSAVDYIDRTHAGGGLPPVPKGD